MKGKDCTEIECCPCPRGRWLGASVAAVAGAVIGFDSLRQPEERLSPSTAGMGYKSLEPYSVAVVAAAAAAAASVFGMKESVRKEMYQMAR